MYIIYFIEEDKSLSNYSSNNKKNKNYNSNTVLKNGQKSKSTFEF